MGRESTAWAGLKSKLVAVGLQTRRMTHRFEAGWPDVVWVSKKPRRMSGWVELKAVERWPMRSGPLRMDISREQTNWIRKWVADGGVAGVLCRVTLAKEWVYWPGSSAVTWPELMLSNPQTLLHVRFPDPLDAKKLVTLFANLEVHL